MNWKKFIGKEEAIKKTYDRIKAQDQRIMEYMFPNVLDGQSPPQDWHEGGATWVAESLGIRHSKLIRRMKKISEAIESIDTGEAKMRRLLALLHVVGEIIAMAGGPESLREDIAQIINRYGERRDGVSPSTYFSDKYSRHEKSGLNRLLYFINSATQIFYRIILRDDVGEVEHSPPTVREFKESGSDIPLQKFSRLQTLINDFKAKHDRAPSNEEVAERMDSLDVETVKDVREDLADV